jgi:hypothetical protein
MSIIVILTFVSFGVVLASGEIKEKYKTMKQELKVLKQSRLMYNNRLGELETELRNLV